MDATTLEILARELIKCFHISKASGNITMEKEISDFFLREGLIQDKTTIVGDLKIDGYETTRKGNQLIKDCFSKIDYKQNLSQSIKDVQYLKKYIVTDIRDYNNANIRPDLKEQYSESIKEHMANYKLFVSKELALTKLAIQLLVDYPKGFDKLEKAILKMNPPSI